MKFTKALLKSGLLDYARKSGSYYTIVDNLTAAFGEITLDYTAGDPWIKVKETKGRIQLINGGDITNIGIQAPRWAYASDKGELLFEPELSPEYVGEV